MSSANWGWNVGVRAPSLITVAFALGLAGCSADLTSQDGIKIGGKDVAWGGDVALTKAEAVALRDGKCAFDVEYPVKNVGKKTAEPAFANRLRVGDSIVAEEAGMTVAAGEASTVRAQVMLPPGQSEISLAIDDDGLVSESDENNNRFTVKVDVAGPCVEPADLAAKDAFTLGNQAGTWGGAAVAVTEADASSNNEGQCTFKLTWEVTNQGAGNAPESAATVRVGETVAGQQGALTFAAGESRQVSMDVALAAGTHTLSVSIDDEGAVTETDKANNKRQVDVTVGGACK